jgi:uncharacterized membrane protein
MAKKNHRSKRLIQSFEAKALRKRSFALKMADILTSYFGTLGFLIFNILLFATWILINTGNIPSIPVFDPFPFVLLITAVSLEAIILAIVVLISQNREGHINTLRDEIQLHVNLLAEREITKILELLRLILKENGVKLSDKDLDEMLKEVDTSYIERRLEEQLSPKQESITQRVEKTLRPKKKK